MTRTRTFTTPIRTSARATLTGLLTASLVLAGGVFFASPATAGTPVVIDDFSGSLAGTRTVSPLPAPNTSTNGGGTFSQAGGVGTMTMNGAGNGQGGVQLDYALPAPVDITSGGNNTQFFLEFNSIKRTPEVIGDLAATVGIVLTDSSGRTSSYSTGISNTDAFNIVLNFFCDGNSVCFSGTADFAHITHVTVTTLYPQSHDSSGRSTTAVLNIIRTTPTGGAIPGAPAPSVTIPTNPVQSTTAKVVHFAVAYTSDGSPKATTGLTAAGLTVTGTATGIGAVSVSTTASGYDVAVGPISTSGTVIVHVNAAATALDNWGQNSLASSGDPTLTFVLGVPPVITSAAATAAIVGVSTSFSVTASGNPAPTFTAGTLPNGLSLSAAGLLSGIPAAGTAGTYAIPITAINFAGTAPQSLLLTIREAPALTSATAATFTSGTSGSFTVTTTGAPTATISSVGGLPSGVTLTDNGNGTATLSGTPPLGSGGLYPISLTAHNGINPDATSTLTLTVIEVPVITSAPATATVVAGNTVTFTAGATGSPTPAVSWQRGTNGAWTTIGGATSASYSFTAAAGDDGVDFRAVFTNAAGTTPTTAAHLTVNTKPAISSPSTATFTVGVDGTFTITATGKPIPAISSSSLPTWLTLVDKADGTATLTGVPPLSAAGAAIALTLTAANSATPNASQNLLITVSQKPVVTTEPAGQTVTPGSSVTLQAAADGYPTPSVKWQRSVDNGQSYQDVAGAISSSFSFLAATSDSGNRYRAVFANAAGSAVTTAATVRVGTAPVFTSSATATFVAGTPGSATVTSTGSPLPTISATSLPVWLTLTDNADGTATLSGTPPLGTAGPVAIALGADNTFAPAASQSYSLVVDAPPALTSPTVATFRVGSPSETTVTTTSGYPTATAIALTGTLPGGLTFTDNGDGTATIGGTPVAGSGGSSAVSLSATAVGGLAGAASQSLTIVVNDIPAFTSADHATFVSGTAGTFTVLTTPGFPVVRSLTVTGLPSGVTFTDQGDGTAIIAGTATVGGSYPLSLVASNGLSVHGMQAFVLTVDASPTITAASSASFGVGIAGDFTVTTIAGFPTTRTLSVVGALPAGITFADNGDGTATFAGTAAAGSGGDYPVTVSATSAGGTAPSAAKSILLSVSEVPLFTGADHATFTTGTGGSFTVTTSPGFPVVHTVTASDPLPAGVTFTDNGDGTATIAGTPTVGGSFALSLVTSNGLPVHGTQAFTLTVTTPPVFVGSPVLDFTVGASGASTILTAPGVPVSTSISVTGALPAGITVHDNGDGTATVGGVPAPGTAGSYPVTVTASNGVTTDATQPATITVSAAAAIALPAVLPTPDGAVTDAPATAPSGSTIRVSGSGFAAGAPITIGIYSTPTFLGSIVADAAGAFSTTVTLPSFTGNHTIVVAGVGADGTSRFLASAITLTALAAPAAVATGLAATGLARTGADVGGALAGGSLLALLGFVLLGLRLLTRGRRARATR